MDKVINKIDYTLTKEDNNELMYTTIVIFVLMGVIYFNAFENNNYTCKNILLNVYLYVLVTLLIFHVITLYFVKIKLHIQYYKVFSSFNIIVSIVALIFILLGLFFTFDYVENNIIASHIILLLLIGFFSLLTSIKYAVLKKNNIYNKVLYTTVALVCMLLFIFYLYQDKLKAYLNEDYVFMVVMLLILVIIIELLYILIYGYTKLITIVISTLVILIFGYMLLADTQYVLNITPDNCKTALKNCNTNLLNPNCNINDYPSYPQKSFKIFHDIIVIFQNLANIFLTSE